MSSKESSSWGCGDCAVAGDAGAGAEGAGVMEVTRCSNGSSVTNSAGVRNAGSSAASLIFSTAIPAQFGADAKWEE